MSGAGARGRVADVLARLAPRRRVPVLQQMSTVECGAACLAMVLGYHGRRTTVAECREAVGMGRDGATARSLAAAARGFGLTVRAFSVPLAEVPLVPLPAIAHWGFNHFVVVERVTERGARIVDPAVGARELSIEEFDEGFTGVMLTFEPGPDFSRRPRTEAPPRRARLLAALREARAGRVIAQVLAASLVLQVLGLALPVLTKVLVDGVLRFEAGSVMPLLGAGMVVLVLAQMTTGYLRAALLVHLQGTLDARLMVGFFGHLVSLPYRYFQLRTTGDLLNRLHSNLVLREVLSSQAVALILDGTFVLGYLLVLMLLAPVFGAVALGIAALQAAIVLLTTRRTHALMQRELGAQARTSSFAMEALNGIAVLKASGSEAQAAERWTSLFHTQLNVSLQRGHLSALVDTALGTLRVASPLALLWIGGHAVLQGSMSLGTMLALHAVTVSFLAPISSLLVSGRQLQLVGAHLDRMLDVLGAEPEQAEARPATPRLSGAIELRGVGFRYAPDAPATLAGISLRVEPGQKVAIVGATGSGKSTLAALLLGLYAPTEGEILFDGRPAAGLDLRSLRAQFGVVLQDSLLFSGSIRENLAFHAPGVGLDQVVAAARAAHIHGEITRMPMGYETRLAEGGAGLSGGQRQRLAIARALVRQPAVLVLDEATSSLDSITEQQVDDSLNSLCCTRIVIAHRMSTVRNADLIVVLDGGTIAEQGTHEELLEGGGLYAALLDRQRDTGTAGQRALAFA